MMDDPELIIYIIFLAISLLGGVWKNIMKKKQEGEAKREPVAQTISQDDLDELFEQQRREQELARERLEQMTAEVAEPEVQAAQYNPRPERITKPKLKPTKKRPAVSEVEQTSDTVDLEDFDVRKAIIYSEILNPPYL